MRMFMATFFISQKLGTRMPVFKRQVEKDL